MRSAVSTPARLHMQSEEQQNTCKRANNKNTHAQAAYARVGALHTCVQHAQLNQHTCKTAQAL
jgi:hypothetical protein